MDGYQLISLKEMLDTIGEERVKAILSNFSCPLNGDVEYFLKHRAISFAKQGMSPTHLVFSSYQGEPVLVGYFTLTVKSFFIQKNRVSSTCYKRISKFGQYIPEKNGCEIPAPLVAQLGKNFTNGLNRLITGAELLKLATDKVALFQQSVGGKVVYLECEDKAKLLAFYQANGFVPFDKRPRDRDEAGVETEYLIQLLKIRKTE